jgi:hypothetical protein
MQAEEEDTLSKKSVVSLNDVTANSEHACNRTAAPAHEARSCMQAAAALLLLAKDDLASNSVVSANTVMANWVT